MGCWLSTAGRRQFVNSSDSPRRAAVLDEIVSSERVYTAGIGFLVDMYLKPCREQQFLKERQIDRLFCNTEAMYDFHQMLYSKLENATSLPEVFIKLGDHLRMYAAFVNQYDDIQKTYDKVRNLPEWMKLESAALEKEPNGARSLFANLVITPVQRVPRYELLFRDLLKQTDEQHPERSQVEAALELAKELNVHINETKRSVENMGLGQRMKGMLRGGSPKQTQEALQSSANTTRLIALQKRIKGYADTSFVQHGRVFLHEEKATQRTTGILGSGTAQRSLFLLSDLLVWTNESDEYRGQTPLHLVGFVKRTDAPDGSDKHWFELAALDVRGEKKVLCEFGCDSVDVCVAWVQRIGATLEKLKRS